MKMKVMNGSDPRNGEGWTMLRLPSPPAPSPRVPKVLERPDNAHYYAHYAGGVRFASQNGQSSQLLELPQHSKNGHRLNSLIHSPPFWVIA